MNEKILDALMRLFALITDPDDFSNLGRSRSVVEAYLHRMLSLHLVEVYLARYDDYLSQYQTRNTGNEVRKKISVSSVKMLKICDQLNLQLHHTEKIYVLIQLIEYGHIDTKMSDREREFVETVSEAFNMDRDEFRNLLAFLENDMSLASDRRQFLFIDSRPDSIEDTKHIISPEMDGYIRILYLPSISSYYFIYTGVKTLTINGRPIQPAKAQLFENGGIIRGNKIGSIYQSNIANIFRSNPESQKITFCGVNCEFSYKNYDNGLKPFSFTLESGTLVGIMGGSGTGKSTLLNVLTGKYKLDSGSIFINGHNTAESIPEGIIGMVPQDDLLIEELSVWQNLYYNSKLCLGNLQEKELVKHVEKVLRDLDLYEIRDLQVGDALNNVISGGQRKRLNIALELVREPSILFVDEPTSGLSSTDSETVMQLLKQQAMSGKIVIVNIHQPSSNIFKMFDRLWVMDRGGYIVYNGNPMEAVTYFKLLSDYVDAGESECPTCGTVNSEEILQILESRVVNERGYYTQERKVSPQEWYKRYKESREFEFTDETTAANSITPLPPTKFTIPGKMKQFWIYFKRNVISKLSNHQYLAITFLESPLLAFILGFFTKYINDEGEYVFADNRNLPVFLFMIVVVALFTGLTGSAEEIIRDRKILEREKFLNLSRFSYISNKVLLVFLISAIQTISFILIANQILEIKGMTMDYWWVMFTTSCCANMMGLLISSALDSVIAIYVLIPFLLVPQMLLGGAMIDFDDLHESVSDKINVPAIGDLMVSRWAYEALAVDQFQNNVYEREFYELDVDKSRCVYLSTYLMSELDNIATRCINITKMEEPDEDDKEELCDLLQILKNEIEYLNYRNPSIYFEHTAEIVPDKFNDMIGNFLQLFLRAQKEFYNEAAEEANAERQALLGELEEELGKDGLYQLQKDYYNEKLAELVLNKRAVKKFYNAPNHRLIQKKDPIFMEPVSDWGRAHFYAPCKIIKNNRIPTYRFNMAVLWIWSTLMFVALILDIPRKAVTWISKFVVRKKNRNRNRQ
ncbi:MAG: ATP-binding cassette domain-containing protein [Bacteroidales bacterium]|nr:ATP-binding cassette domain-containing protein [Bacteroidales bacterium]